MQNHLRDCSQRRLLCVGVFLFSRAVSSQVFSAPLSLTSVFGMGTGGPSVSSTPTSSALPFGCLFIYLSPFGVNIHGDSWGNRTPVTGVRGRCLNRLTNEPLLGANSLAPLGAPSGTRTRDTLIKSQVLYQLS